MRLKKVLFTAGLAALPFAAHATWESDQYKSMGTAYRYVTGTDVIATSGTTVSATAALATSDTSVVRIDCDQPAKFVPVKLGATASVSPSGLKLEANTPEYFPLDTDSVPAIRAVNATATCNVSRMKK